MKTNTFHLYTFQEPQVVKMMNALFIIPAITYKLCCEQAFLLYHQLETCRTIFKNWYHYSKLLSLSSPS